MMLSSMLGLLINNSNQSYLKPFLLNTLLLLIKIYTVKPLLIGFPIKPTPSITRTLSQVQKLTSYISLLIIYTKKLPNSDWLRKECSSSVTRKQTCNTSANYKKMVSDWLPRSKNQSTKFKKMAMVFSRRRRDLLLYVKQQ